MKTLSNYQLFIINCVTFYVILSGLMVTIHGFTSGNVLNIIFGISSVGFLYGLIRLRQSIRNLEKKSGDLLR